MTIYLPELEPDQFSFPSPNKALKEPNGLLAMGGDLKPARLLNAYHNGIFPWYSPGEPILWWSPSPRAIFIPSEFKPSKSLKKFYRKGNFKISINKATSKVISQCAQMRAADETWLDSRMQRAYSQLASLGHCHSVEIWRGDALVGGLYGILVGNMFCGESMFSQETNGSKIALWALCTQLAKYGGELIDCQVINPHTQSLGAREIDREQYLAILNRCRKNSIDKECFQPQYLYDDFLLSGA